MIVLIIIACITTAAATNSTTTKDTVETSTNSTKEILKASETADPKFEIVKQIRRLNDDGSYTIGYEADDGTFKIENRDVLGNVKGTFGYIDQDGEIKRVTYTSSSDSTPVPVSTSTTPSTPIMVVRMNKTVSSTTRRPLATVVYPTRGSYTTRGTVIQSIPRRRVHSTRMPHEETSTETPKPEETTTNTLNLYKIKTEEMKTRMQILTPIAATVKEDFMTKQTTTQHPATLKPVYEPDAERAPESENKANTIRRELTGTSPNPHMISLQQSVGDDSTDVYGSHLSMGTVRPLFTTTTPRPRLVPLHSLVAARQKMRQQYQDQAAQGIQEQETTIEASTGRVFDEDSIVTTNPVPVVHIQPQRQREQRVYDQPIYRRPSTAAQFRTREYLRDNPGAAIPIGNQRPFLQYEFQDQVLEPQFMKDSSQASQKTAEATDQPFEARPVTRFIPIPVDERGVPIHGYQARYVNPYRPQPVYQPRYEPVDEMAAISAPVSTRDLRRLLHILLMRQNRLQNIMDQMMPPPLYRDNDYRYQNRYNDDDRYDYRYDQYRQEMYKNQFDNQYESQRYMPRRRGYTRPYDTEGSSSNHLDDMPEFLPPEIREALLLKMLILAINPDYVPTPAPPTELTTAAPPRKQVRNVQILGVEGSIDDKGNHRH